MRAANFHEYMRKEQFNQSINDDIKQISMSAFRSKLTINAANYGYLASNQRLQDCRLNLLAYNLLITCLATASGLPTLQPPPNQVFSDCSFYYGSFASHLKSHHHPHYKCHRKTD